MRGWVLVTRAAEGLVELGKALEPHGITVLPYPVVRRTTWDDPDGWEDVRRVLPELRWIALTSPRAPLGLRERAQAHGLWGDLRVLPAAAVGAATADAASGVGLTVGITGSGGGGALARALVPRLAAGEVVLHPCGREHRPELASALQEGGVRVLSVTVYAMDETPAPELPLLPDGDPLAVLLTSPRAAAAYRRHCGHRLAGTHHYAMGKTTAAAAADLGITAEPLPQASFSSFVEELCQRFS